MENEKDNNLGSALATAIGCVVIGGLYYLADHSLFTIIIVLKVIQKIFP